MDRVMSRYHQRQNLLYPSHAHDAPCPPLCHHWRHPSSPPLASVYVMRAMHHIYGNYPISSSTTYLVQTCSKIDKCRPFFGRERICDAGSSVTVAEAAAAVPGH